MWLACYTQEEIAGKENITHQQASEIVLQISENLPKSAKVLAGHAEPDFKPPISNIWKWQEKTAGSRHLGNSEGGRFLLTLGIRLDIKPFQILNPR
jgi:hypothetical protein